MDAIGPALFYVSLPLMLAWGYYYGKASGGWGTDLKRLHERPEYATLTPEEQTALRRSQLAMRLALATLFLSVVLGMLSRSGA